MGSPADMASSVFLYRKKKEGGLLRERDGRAPFWLGLFYRGKPRLLYGATFFEIDQGFPYLSDSRFGPCAGSGPGVWCLRRLKVAAAPVDRMSAVSKTWHGSHFQPTREQSKPVEYERINAVCGVRGDRFRAPCPGDLGGGTI